MNRYIDADALIAFIRNQYFQSDMPEEWGNGVMWATSQINYYCNKEAPSIDIEPKRGEWKPFDLTWGRSIWYCTACEESTEVPCDIWEHKPIYKYCPNCGAKMDGEREGE